MKTTIGPIQLIVVGFESNQRFRGNIMRELNKTRVKGVIRLLDLLFVLKDQQGNISAFQETDLSREEEAEFGALINQMMGLTAADDQAGAATARLGLAEYEYGLTAEDVQHVAERIEPGTSAALLLIEHVWAADLKMAIGQAGGRMVAQGFLTPAAMLMVGKELEVMAEAAAAIEVARAMKGAALLDALVTVAEAEEMKETAAQEAWTVVAEAEEMKETAAQEAWEAVATATKRVKTAAVAKAVRSLIAAGLMDRADAEAAISTLLAARLLEDSSVTEATRIVEEAEAIATTAFEAAETEGGDDTAAQPER